MPRLDVCLETVFTDLRVEERIKKIAAAGYKWVECWFHDATFDGKTLNKNLGKDARALGQACRAAGVKINNMVVNAPDGSFGGSPVASSDHGQYLERLDAVISFAQAADCHAAITCSGNLQPGLRRQEMRANLEKALGDAAAMAQKRKFTLFLEPLNTHVDHQGYYLDSSSEGAEIVRAVDNPHLRLLYDVYHMQIMEGNLTANISKNISIIGHFHSAAVPGRGEHFQGETDYPQLLKRLDTLGYKGRFGLEYFPAMPDHSKSLRRVREYLQSAP